LYSKIIVSELGLTHEEKTLKPTAIGGIAGGSKWYVDSQIPFHLIIRICNGILFKFALDVKLKNGRFIYGGDKCNDEKAMKSACKD
jgi:hypothetical protein